MRVQPGYRMRARKIGPELPDALTQLYGNGRVVQAIRLWKYPHWTTLGVGTRVEIVAREGDMARIEWQYGNALVSGEKVKESK